MTTKHARSIATVLALLPVAILLAGCGAQPNTTTVADPAGEPLPGWVLVVPVEEDGRSLFVGGCSMALTGGEGIETATTDAHLQITSLSRTRFTDVFALAPRESGVTTTSIDRLDFRETGLERYPEAMVASATLDRVVMRSCETGEMWELPGPDPESPFEGTACSVFVQVSFPAEAWERNLAETLQEMRHEFRASGRENLAELADWIEGNLSERSDGTDERGGEAGAGDR